MARKKAGNEYKNVGDSVVFGAQPGETFTAELTEEQVQALVEGGHIEAPSGSTAGKEE